MPFVNIRVVKGVLGAEAKAKISQEVTQLITDSAGIPKDSVWVVFEDIPATEWHVGARTVQQRSEDG